MKTNPYIDLLVGSEYTESLPDVDNNSPPPGYRPVCLLDRPCYPRQGGQGAVYAGNPEMISTMAYV